MLNPPKLPPGKYLRNQSTGVVFIYSQELYDRGDMEIIIIPGSGDIAIPEVVQQHTEAVEVDSLMITADATGNWETWLAPDSSPLMKSIAKLANKENLTWDGVDDWSPDYAKLGKGLSTRAVSAALSEFKRMVKEG